MWCLVLMLGAQAGAQYYYFDILGTKQTNDQFKKISANQIQKISATSFEGNSQPSTDFVLEQSIDLINRMIITRSASINSKESFFTSYFKNNRLYKTVDSNMSAINTVIYDYADNNHLLATRSTNKDFDGTYDQTEVHQWKYNDQGKPAGMLKVKNGADTTIINFKTDDAGNIIQEDWLKNNRVIETYYYYYNARNKLTDIVRYNRRARQMLPDFIFEYDAQGQLVQMTQTQGASANYLTWRYLYNNKGMKDKEFVFNKQKELLGKIEYNYQ